MQVDCPVAPCAVPGGHDVQIVDADVDKYVPAPHAMHCTEPSFEEKDPAAHDAHACEFAVLDFPLEQSSQS